MDCQSKRSDIDHYGTGCDHRQSSDPVLDCDLDLGSSFPASINAVTMVTDSCSLPNCIDVASLAGASLLTEAE